MTRFPLFALFSLLLLSAAARAEEMKCFNGATRAAITVQKDRWSGQTFFQMNGELAKALYAQDSSSVLMQGHGEANWNPSDFSFSSGAPKGYSLLLRSDSGGIMLTWIAYVDFQARKPHATFYFNWGECRIL